MSLTLGIDRPASTPTKRGGGGVRLALWVLLYCAVLFWSYRQLAPLYSYRGLVYRTPSPGAFLAATVLTVQLRPREYYSRGFRVP